MSSARVSVIVPAHNAEPTLPALLEQLRAQAGECPGVEAIIVDSASVDRTYELAVGAGVRVLRAPAPGASVARNAGIGAAQGDLLVFLDSDCLPRSGWLKGLVRCAETNPRVGAAGGRVVAAPARGLLQRHAERAGYYISQEAALADRFLPFVLTANCCYRREVLERLGGFDEELRSGEDTQLAWRMQLELGLEVAYARDAVVEHVHRSTLPGMWRQWVRYGYGEVQLADRFHSRPAPAKPSRRQVQRVLSELGGSVRAAARLVVGRGELLDVVSPLLRCLEVAATRSGRAAAIRDLGRSAP